MESPCEFCRSRMISASCIKLLGPKTEERSFHCIGPSRALTKYDASIDLNDVRVLQLAFSDEFRCKLPRPYFERFFRNAASVYGPFIDHAALRHAFLAYFTAFYDVGNPLQHLEYATSACYALRQKLDDPATLDEVDLFVSFLLAQWGMAIGETVAFHSNMLGFASIKKQLSNRVGGDIRSYQLAVFWPMASDHLDRARLYYNIP